MHELNPLGDQLFRMLGIDLDMAPFVVESEVSDDNWDAKNPDVSAHCEFLDVSIRQVENMTADLNKLARRPSLPPLLKKKKREGAAPQVMRGPDLTFERGSKGDQKLAPLRRKKKRTLAIKRKRHPHEEKKTPACGYEG